MVEEVVRLEEDGPLDLDLRDCSRGEEEEDTLKEGGEGE